MESAARLNLEVSAKLHLHLRRLCQHTWYLFMKFCHDYCCFALLDYLTWIGDTVYGWQAPAPIPSHRV